MSAKSYGNSTTTPTHLEAMLALEKCACDSEPGCRECETVRARLKATEGFDRLCRTAEGQSDHLMGCRRTIRALKEQLAEMGVTALNREAP